MCRSSLLVSVFVLLLSACDGTAAVQADDAAAPPSDQGLKLAPIQTNLDKPWGMDFLNDGELLVTQQGGKVLRVELASGETTEISGVPEATEKGQGGMLDVLVEKTPQGDRVYLSYTHAGEEGFTTRVSRGMLQGDSLVDTEVLFTAQPYYKTGHHFGSRLLIVDDYLFITVGDRGRRDYAQDLSRHNGSVIRLHRDGRVPEDNPFVGSSDALPEIWTYGHRNPQGLAQHPNGSLWVSEHGPKGGDELNVLEPGNNYGWPIITYGEEYRGGKIGEGTEKEGMEQPVKYYVPSIATCGMDFYSGDTYPGWNDSLLVAARALTHLNRVELDGAGLGAEHRYFADSKLRFRDVQVGPDGYVYVFAGNGLYRIVPEQSVAKVGG